VGIVLTLILIRRKHMSDVCEIISIDPSESFQDVDKDLYNIAEYIAKLEKRISELEDKMDLIESRSDLLQSSEERYYSSLGEDE
jgi:DNA replication initiation complex subunit (GINS family)